MEEIWGTAAPSKQDRRTVDPPETNLADDFNQLPASPAALLDFLASDAYRQAQEAHSERVQESFKVLHGCPWVAQRPLLTVAVPRPGKEDPAAYTLPVAVHQVCPSHLLHV